MAQLSLLNAYHQNNDYAGSAMAEHAIKVTLSEDIAFGTDEAFKHGGVPITYTGKLALGDTADNARIMGFMYAWELGQLSSIVPQIPKTGDVIPVCHVFVGEMDTAKAPGTPIYLDDTGHYNDDVASSTTGKIMGRYIAYDDVDTVNSTFAEFRREGIA